MKLVDALAIRFHHIKGGGRRDCPAIVPTYADSRQASAAGIAGRARASAPTARRTCSSPRSRFPWQIPTSHAEGSCCAPRRSVPGWPRAASCRPLPAPAFHGSEHRALAPPGLPRPPLTNADYWRFADWLAPYFDAVWVPEKNLYGSGNSGVGRIYHNSMLLTTHAVAALSGHQGPCRNDERARALARRLCDSPPWSERDASPEGDPQFHNPGWVESMGTREAAMDKSIDPKVAEALMYAWRARDVLRLPQETVDLIVDRVNRCARGPFFRFPNVRLNQINWNCELYAHNATVTGNAELLVNDYRAQVVRFCDGITRAALPGGSPNLGPGYRFHYLPHRPPDAPLQHRQRGVRERDDPLHPLLRAGARRRHGPDRARAGEPAAGLGRARPVRVLDARRLSELGHGLRVQALARRPHVGAGAAGPAGDRGQPALSPAPRAGRVGQAPVRSRAGPVRASFAGRRRRQGHRALKPVRRQRRTARPEHQGAVRRPDAGERGSSRGARAGWHASARATAVVLVRRRHRPACRDDQALLDRRASCQPARLPVRRHGAVQVVRRRPAGRLERRRPALGELRRPGAPARQGDRDVPASQGGPAAAPASAAAVLPARSRRPGTAVPAAAVCRPVRDTDRAGAHRVRRGDRRHDPPLLRGLDRNTLGDRAPAPRTLHR